MISDYPRSPSRVFGQPQNGVFPAVPTTTTRVIRGVTRHRFTVACECRLPLKSEDDIVTCRRKDCPIKRLQRNCVKTGVGQDSLRAVRQGQTWKSRKASECCLILLFLIFTVWQRCLYGNSLFILNSVIIQRYLGWSKILSDIVEKMWWILQSR